MVPNLPMPGTFLPGARKEPCDIALADNRAVATCATGSPSEPGDSAGAWTIGLERADNGWAIKTIASD